MRTVVVPQLKNRSSDIADRSNYRPISLATVIAQVLDRILDVHLSSRIQLSDSQFGFREGLSTESAILSLKYTADYYTRRKTPVYACFLDLSKAFDTVSHTTLLTDVLGKKLPNSLKRWTAKYLAGRQYYVSFRGTRYQQRRNKKGVPQGGVI